MPRPGSTSVYTWSFLLFIGRYNLGTMLVKRPYLGHGPRSRSGSAGSACFSSWEVLMFGPTALPGKPRRLSS